MDSPGCEPRILRFFSARNQRQRAGAVIRFSGGMATSGSFNRRSSPRTPALYSSLLTPNLLEEPQYSLEFRPVVADWKRDLTLWAHLSAGPSGESFAEIQ